MLMYCPPGLKCIRRPHWIPLRCAHFVPPNFRLLRLLLLSSILPLLLVAFLLKDILRNGRTLTSIYILSKLHGVISLSAFWGCIVRTRNIKNIKVHIKIFLRCQSVLSISLKFLVLLHSTPLLRTLDFLSLLTWARKPRLDSNCRTHKMLSHFCVKLL